MKFKANEISKLTNDKGEVIIQLKAVDRQSALYGYSQIKDYKELSVEIKKYRAKRSLSANGYLWVLLNKIACVVNRSKEDVYLEMLKRYGVFTHIIAKPNMIDKIKSEWKTVEVLDEKQIGSQKGVQLLCYFGSSTYDTKEFTQLLDGVISEAKELDIETITPQEKALLMESYEVNSEK